MLDLRGIYRIISRKIHDFSEEQLANVNAIVWLYRGETDRYLTLVRDYLQTSQDATAHLSHALAALDTPSAKLSDAIQQLLASAPKDADQEALASLKETAQARDEALRSFTDARSELLSDLSAWVDAQGSQAPTINKAQTAHHASFQPFVEHLIALRRQVNELHKLTNRIFDSARLDLRATRWSTWDGSAFNSQLDALGHARQDTLAAVKAIIHPIAQATWLQSRFPDAEFVDVPGLCKIVSTNDMAEQDYSLTPGRYVGVSPPESEDEEAVEERLNEIHVELASLSEEAAELAQIIATNFEDLLG